MEIELEKVNLDRFYSQKLYKDYIFNFQRVSDFYQYDFRKISEYFKRASDIYNGYNHTLRSRISSILKVYNSEHGCQVKTLENISSLEDEKTLVVIGGHQPGLLVSPLFIIYKILTILKVSSFLEKELGVKVIPCLWNASDDGNLASIKVAKILNRDLEEITLNLNDIGEDTRYSNIVLPASVFRKVIEELKNVLTP
ncbi:MAG: bacillithiol biosynthesis BshC, partial [Actinobacteria bacterium]|nr:bacillithiol biosynthesis BshC [Actinomycetota bacterium]